MQSTALRATSDFSFACAARPQFPRLTVCAGAGLVKLRCVDAVKPNLGVRRLQRVAVDSLNLILDHEMDVLLDPAIARDQRHEDQHDDDADQASKLLL